jgi:hypothetical protein
MKFDHLRELFRVLTVELETQFGNGWHHCERCGYPTPSTLERAVRPPGRQSWILLLRIRLFDARNHWHCRICKNLDKIQSMRRDLEKLYEDPEISTSMSERSAIR